jgi:hypothetical protein
LYNADDQLVDQLIQLHNNSDLQEEKMRIAVSLGSVRKEEMIKKVLKFAISVNENYPYLYRIIQIVI